MQPGWLHSSWLWSWFPCGSAARPPHGWLQTAAEFCRMFNISSYPAMPSVEKSHSLLALWRFFLAYDYLIVLKMKSQCHKQHIHSWIKIVLISRGQKCGKQPYTARQIILLEFFASKISGQYIRVFYSSITNIFSGLEQISCWFWYLAQIMRNLHFPVAQYLRLLSSASRLWKTTACIASSICRTYFHRKINKFLWHLNG